MAAPRRPISPVVHCTRCDTRIAYVDEDRLVLSGKRPLELVAHPQGSPLHIVCSACGTLVPLDDSLLVLH